MKLLPIAILALATVASAQTITKLPDTWTADPPDCRTTDLQIGQVCWFPGAMPPIQRFLGYIAEPGSPQVGMTEPLTDHSAIAPAVKGQRRTYAIGGMYGIQSETFNYHKLVSDSVKVFADASLTPHFGVEARFTRVDAYIAEIGHYAGQNHTQAGSVGPVLSGKVGPLRPYFTAQVGAIHQQYYGVTVGGAVGVDATITKHISWRVLDGEYRYAVAMPSYRNPRRGRIEFGTGLDYRF